MLQRQLHLRRLADGVFGQRMAGMHGLDRRADAVLQARDHLLDFRRGFLRALCQSAHLVGHDRETASLLAGAGRLDGRALRASRLVCSAMVLITSSTWLIARLSPASWLITVTDCSISLARR